jgi:hypothetical protein
VTQWQHNRCHMHVGSRERGGDNQHSGVVFSGGGGNKEEWAGSASNEEGTNGDGLKSGRA